MGHGLRLLDQTPQTGGGGPEERRPEVGLTPAQQRFMSARAGARISTVDAGHLSLVTRPTTVADLITTAARTVG